MFDERPDSLTISNPKKFRIPMALQAEGSCRGNEVYLGQDWLHGRSLAFNPRHTRSGVSGNASKRTPVASWTAAATAAAAGR